MSEQLTIDDFLSIFGSKSEIARQCKCHRSTVEREGNEVSFRKANEWMGCALRLGLYIPGSVLVKFKGRL